MKIQVIDTSTHFSGGRLILFRHAAGLAQRGHDVDIWIDGPAELDWLDLPVPVRSMAGMDCRGLPEADLCLFAKHRLARPLWNAQRGIPVHFCQGFEGTDLESRIDALRSGGAAWRRLPELWRYWRRLQAVDHSYRTPTAKIVVHPPLRELIARRFEQACHLVPNGLPEGVFEPNLAARDEPPAVLVVGACEAVWKRIPDALAAVRLLRGQGRRLRLLRIAAGPMGEAEQAAAVTDEYHVMLSPAAMAELYNRASVLLFPSDVMEGFGLPALEAMACGTPVLATDIPAFRAFADPADYAHFVPVGRPDLLADALARLLDDPAERARLVRRGRQVAAAYTQERSLNAMENALRRIVAQEAPVASGSRIGHGPEVPRAVSERETAER